MSKEVTDIRQAIQALSGITELTYEGVACKVSDIDLATFTCTCTPINGDAEFFDVLLNADADKGFTLIPKDGSVVIVQQTSQATAYVSMVSKVDQIYLAGDANGGLVKVNDLVSKLNRIENDINVLKLVFSTWVPVPTDGGAALKTAATAWLGQQILPITTINDLSNNTVKHGNG
jgi:hypothetical protein